MAPSPARNRLRRSIRWLKTLWSAVKSFVSHASKDNLWRFGTFLVVASIVFMINTIRSQPSEIVEIQKVSAELRIDESDLKEVHSFCDEWNTYCERFNALRATTYEITDNDYKNDSTALTKLGEVQSQTTQLISDISKFQNRLGVLRLESAGASMVLDGLKSHVDSTSKVLASMKKTQDYLRANRPEFNFLGMLDQETGDVDREQSELQNLNENEFKRRFANADQSHMMKHNNAHNLSLWFSVETNLAYLSLVCLVAYGLCVGIGVKNQLRPKKRAIERRWRSSKAKSFDQPFTDC